LKRLLVTLAAVVALVSPASAAAHPLGNFTLNHYGELDVSGSSVYVRFVLDLAEIPTYQVGDRVRAPGYAAQVARELELEVDGRPAALVLVDSRVSEQPGAGGLPTLRFEAVYRADRAGRELVFRDRTFPGRIGWRELVARADGGARIVDATVPAASRSDALRAYPADLLSSPLDVQVARVSYEPGTEPAAVPELGATAAPDRRHGGFESLVAQGDLTLGVILVSLAVAMFWGAAHALTPGHGKAIVAGYLVGSRGKPRHAIGLGLIVTASHTIGVFALGLVTLLLSQFVVPERLYPWLTLVSGLLVVGVGISVFRARLRHRRAHAHHEHHHQHDHETRGLLGVGVAAGILPCPSALVVLLSAIALHRVGFGLALIFAFSAGLALTISSIGLLAVLARRTFGRLRLDGPLVRVLPAASALLILGVGVAITLNALPEVL
jgi:nickel/cobalt transporter (NicO) family protein